MAKVIYCNMIRLVYVDISVRPTHMNHH